MKADDGERPESGHGEVSDDLQLDQFVHSALDSLETGSPEPDLGHLDPAVRDDAKELLVLLRAAWNSEIALPRLEEDPVAVRLGFFKAPTDGVETSVSAEPTVPVNGPKLKTLRQQQHLDVRQLSNAIIKFGGTLSLADLVRCERQPIYELSLVNATALSSSLHCSITSFVGDPNHLDGFLEFLYSQAFDAEISAWSAEFSRDPNDVAGQARRRLLAGQRRSVGAGDAAGWLDLLRAVLASLR